MKIPRPISDAEYERKLNVLIANLDDLKSGHPSLLPPESILRRIFESVQQRGTAGYYEIADDCGITHVSHPNPQMQHLGGRVGYLVNYGWLVDAPTVPRRVVARWGYRTVHTKRFAIGPGPTRGLLPQRIERFNKAVDALDARRGLRACIAQRIESHHHHHSDRNAEIIRRRLEGENLAAIARDYDISRERARQIVERAVEGRDRWHHVAAVGRKSTGRPVGRPRTSTKYWEDAL